MRNVLVVSAIVVIIAIVAADMAAPTWAHFEPGSYEVQLTADGLDLLPDEADCDQPGSATYPCTRRFAYRPNGTVRVWVSVRNSAPIGLGLDGVSEDWLAQFPDDMLARPVTVLDGGDPAVALASPELVGTPFKAVTLEPGAERLVGLEYRTTSDVAYACEHWAEGGGVEWETVPVSWHWLVAFHAREIPLAAPIEFMAPTAADCTS